MSSYSLVIHPLLIGILVQPRRHTHDHVRDGPLVCDGPLVRDGDAPLGAKGKERERTDKWQWRRARRYLL